MSTRRAFVYVRQSVTHAEGIERGIARAERLVRDRGWALVQTYSDDGVSASKARGKNTGWGQMVAAIKAGNADTVVGVDIDRLARTQRDIITLIDLGVKVVTVDGEIDLSTAEGEFRATLGVALARMEVQRKSERQLRANEYRVSNGLPTPGGRRRFGFESDHVTIVPDEADWIRHIFERAAEGASIRSLARELNAAGVRTVDERLRIKDRPDKPAAGKWDSPRLQKILVNPAYNGKVIHHKQAWPSEHVPKIVDDELFERVVAIKSDPSRRTSPGSERTALLGRLVKCGTCGADMVTAGTKDTRRDMAIGLYNCDIHRALMKQGKKDGVSHPSIRRSILDPRVVSAVVSAFIFGRQEIAAMPTTANHASIDSQLRDIALRKDELLKLVAAGDATSRDVAPMLKALTAQSEVAETERDALLAASAHARFLVDAQRDLLAPGPVDIEKLSDLRRDLLAKFESLDLDTKRTLIESLLEITVFPGRGTSRVRIWHKVATSLNEDNENIAG